MIVNSIILGRAKGSAGNVTTTTVKGRVILKQKASQVRNPKSAKQMAQRAKLSAAVVAWQLAGSFVKSGINGLSEYGNEYNAFVSANSHLLEHKPLVKGEATFSDLVGLYATIGNTSAVRPVMAALGNRTAAADVQIASATAGVKAGDKIVFLVCNSRGTDAHRNSYTITADDVRDGSFQASATIKELDQMFDPVVAVWYESADGRLSTTSYFEAYNDGDVKM